MSFFNSVGSALLALISFVANIVIGTFQMLANIPYALQMLVGVIGYMPTVLVSFAMALVTVNIVYLIIGR